MRATGTDFARCVKPSRPRPVLPWGDVRTDDGIIVIDEAAAVMIIDAFEQAGREIPIKWEPGQPGGSFVVNALRSKTAGTIRDLRAKPSDGIFASIDWTAEAGDAIAVREAAYLEPRLKVRESDGRVMEILAVELVSEARSNLACDVTR
jgi:phage I-like protein